MDESSATEGSEEKEPPGVIGQPIRERLIKFYGEDAHGLAVLRKFALEQFIENRRSRAHEPPQCPVPQRLCRGGSNQNDRSRCRHGNPRLRPEEPAS